MTIEETTASMQSAAMMQLLMGFQSSQALYVVANLGIATVLHQEGPVTVAELAERTECDARALSRLVRALAPLGVFRTEGDRVGITPLGATLSRTHPHSLHGAARMLMETHYLPFSELTHSVRVGEPCATKYFGESLFAWLSRDGERERLFSQAMSDLTSSLRSAMFDGYTLPPGGTIADIGGSDGSVLVELLTRDGDVTRRGVVFDRPTAIANAEARILAAGLGDRVATIAGDFFAAVPTADVYVLAFILHDWSDADSVRILGSIAAAATTGARVLLLEGLIPPGDGPHLVKTVDLTMLGMMTGRERSVEEYRHLLAASGFTLDRVVETSSPFAIVEATLN